MSRLEVLQNMHAWHSPDTAGKVFFWAIGDTPCGQGAQGLMLVIANASHACRFRQRRAPRELTYFAFETPRIVDKSLEGAQRVCNVICQPGVVKRA